MHDDVLAEEPLESRRRSRGKLAIGILDAAVAIAALLAAGHWLGGGVPRATAWVQGLGAWAPLGFILAYAVATVAFVPGSLLTLAAGVLFGLAWGTVYTLIGATLGAALAFVVARYLARGAVERRIAGNPRFASIDRAVGDQGFKIVALLRLSPLFPFNLLNYALGLTRVRFLPYLAASIAMLPGTLLYVYYGTAIGSLVALGAGGAARKGAGSWGLLGIGLVATVVVTTYVTRIASRALREKQAAAPAASQAAQTEPSHD